jgi:hypothetical protein
MSPREKKLLILFTAAGFLVVNFLGFSWYQRLKVSVRNGLTEAESSLQRAEFNLANHEQIAAQMEWLAEREPEPKASQDAQASLQEFVGQKAREANLNVRGQKFLPVNDSGAHFHRAGIQIEVTGREEALYQWFNSIKSPEEFRATTKIIMNPNREDDTLIDCRADIEQWFIPAEPGA